MTRTTILLGSLLAGCCAQPAPIPPAAPFAVEGRFVEACSCTGACAAELTGHSPGCDGVAAIAVDRGTYDGHDISGVRIAAAGYAGDQVSLYIDAPAEKWRAAEAFARGVFASWGKIQEASVTDVAIAGSDTNYSVRVGGGQILSFDTEAVPGVDADHPVLVEHTVNALSPTFHQGHCLGATFRDRGHSFTIPAGRNSFYNPSLKATGKL
jgi:hypothetical protein